MEQNTYNRAIPVVAAFLIQLCSGVAYLWSLFQTGIAKSLFSGNNAEAAITFSLLLACLGFGGIIAGRMTTKFSIPVIMITGGFIVAAGFFFASLVTAQAPWLLWLTYGVMGGIGIGMTYGTSIAVAQRWYPDHRGLVTGMLVSALGLGGVLFTPVIEGLIKYFGGPQVGEIKTFMALSIIFAVVCTICGIFLKNPPEGYAPKGWVMSTANKGVAPKDYSANEVLTTPQFYLLSTAFALASMGGLMMIGFAKPIAVAKNMAATATIGVLIIAICNSAGRLFWGFVSDRIGRKNAIMILLVGTGTLSLFVNMASGYYIYVLIAFIGFFYGGFLGTFPVLTADLFGQKNMATNYGMVLVGFGVGAVVASYIAGYYKNLAAANIDLMFPAFIIASVCAFVSIGLVWSIKPTKVEYGVVK